MAKKDDDEEISLDLKAFQKKGRYVHTREGYIIDRLFFQLFALFLVVTSIGAFFMLGGFGAEYAYASCPSDAVGGKCGNALFGECDLPACMKEYLSPGETIGEKPPSFFGFYVLQGILFACVVALNHLVYNYEGKVKK